MAKLPKEAEGVTLTFSQKISNFWFYNKWKSILAIVICIIIGSSVYSCATKVNYDCTVAIALSTELADASISQLAKELTPYCEDYNNDGEVNLNVYNCCFEDSAEGISNSPRSHYTNFVTSFMEAENMIYIVDKDKIDFVDDDEFMDANLNLPDLNGRGILLNGTDFEETCKEKCYFALPEETYMVRRSYDGQITKKKNAELHFKNAGKFITKFLNKIKQQ